ncbi:MAG: HEAT repeat domain-containing protein [Planctomycetes bacterium]|nr:HEAT repeat domain-containing protein [Planctomycetota bacterium]
MAICCKICGTELEALAGKRCRKCRQLVCHDCLENPDDGGSNGYICVDCAKNPDPANTEVGEEEKPVPSRVAPAPARTGGSRVIPTWLWVIFGLALGGIFIIIALSRHIKYETLERNLRSGQAEVSRSAALSLSEMGSERAFGILVKSMREGASETERIAAIDGLGYFPDKKSVDYLTEIYENPTLSEAIRLSAKESIQRQKMRLESNAGGGGN